MSDEQVKHSSKYTLSNNWDYSHESKSNNSNQKNLKDSKYKITPAPFKIEQFIGNGLLDNNNQTDNSKISFSNQKNSTIF